MGKTLAMLALVLIAIGAAGFSIYRTYFAEAPTHISPQERAAAFQKMKAFEHPGK